MWKYLRIVTFAWLEFIYDYLFVVIPNLLLKRLLSLPYRYRELRKAIHRLIKYLRLDLHITNANLVDPTQRYFIVTNHHSVLDPFLAIYLFEHPVRFLAKNESRKMLFFGDATASIDTLFINRKSVRSQLDTLALMQQAMTEKQTHWLVYPEATRNKQYSQPLLPFKAGAFKQAMEAKATILPMVTYGFFRPLDPKLNWKRYPIQVEFLSPITPDKYEGKSTVEVSDMVQVQMQVVSDKMFLQDQILRGKI
jgi:1-acyl-sn-glycerol-3-phosphate acyltransferase